MLNFGLLLRKPAESRYAQYRRFLIVNHSLYVNNGRITRALRKYASRYFNIDCKGILVSDLSSQVENQILKSKGKQPELQLLKTSHNPRVIKNCSLCSKNGFHSEAFNLDWVLVCPIHMESLTPRCDVCLQKWPTCSKLLSTNCKGCGAKLTVSDLLEQNAYRYDDKYQVIKELLTFAKYALEPVHYRLVADHRDPDALQTEIFESHVNVNSLFIPTANCARSTQSSISISTLIKWHIPTYSKTTLRFPARKYDPYKKIDLSPIEIKQIEFTVEKEIKNSLGTTHNLGKCFRDKKDWDCYCVECKAWLLYLKTSGQISVSYTHLTLPTICSV